MEAVKEEDTVGEVEELNTLAQGKAAGHLREGPQFKAEEKKAQMHCALSSSSTAMLCTFQCNTDT